MKIAAMIMWVALFLGSYLGIGYFEHQLTLRDVKGSIGYFKDIVGQVGYQGYADITWFLAKKQVPIFHGDFIVTKSDSSTELQFYDDSSIVIDANSAIRIKKSNRLDGVLELLLLNGRARVKTGQGDVKVGPDGVALAPGIKREIRIGVAKRTIITAGDGSGAAVSFDRSTKDAIKVEDLEGEVLVKEGNTRKKLSNQATLREQSALAMNRRVLHLDQALVDSQALADASLKEMPEEASPAVLKLDDAQREVPPPDFMPDQQEEALPDEKQSSVEPSPTNIKALGEASSPEQAKEQAEPVKSFAAKKFTGKSKFKSKYKFNPPPMPLSLPPPIVTSEVYTMSDLKSWQGPVILRLKTLKWGTVGANLGAAQNLAYPFEIRLSEASRLHYFASLIAGTDGQYHLEKPGAPLPFAGASTYVLKGDVIIAELRGPFAPSKTLDVIRKILGGTMVVRGNASDVVSTKDFVLGSNQSHIIYVTGKKSIKLESSFLADQKKFSAFLKKYPGVIAKNPLEVLSNN